MFAIDESLHSKSVIHYKIQRKSLEATKTASSSSLFPGAKEYTLTSDTNFSKGKHKIENVDEDMWR